MTRHLFIYFAALFLFACLLGADNRARRFEAALLQAEAALAAFPLRVEQEVEARLEAQRDQQEKIYEELLQRNQQGAREELDRILDINDQLIKELEWYINQYRT